VSLAVVLLGIDQMRLRTEGESEKAGLSNEKRFHHYATVCYIVLTVSFLLSNAVNQSCGEGEGGVRLSARPRDCMMQHESASRWRRTELSSNRRARGIGGLLTQCGKANLKWGFSPSKIRD
jgi:hypothetical protein